MQEGREPLKVEDRGGLKAGEDLGEGVQECTAIRLNNHRTARQRGELLAGIHMGWEDEGQAIPLARKGPSLHIPVSVFFGIRAHGSENGENRIGGLWHGLFPGGRR